MPEYIEDMQKYRYTNTSDKDLSFAGVGVIEAGKTIDTNTQIENPNIKLVKEPSDEKSTVSKEPTKDATSRNKRK